jgi:ATP-dependent protease ClpP protease subunit
MAERKKGTKMKNKQNITSASMKFPSFNNIQVSKSRNMKFPSFDRDDESEDGSVVKQGQLVVPVFQRSFTMNALTIPLDEPIKGPDYYRSVAQSMVALTEHDSVSFHINSPGGQVDGMSTILEAIKNCDAKVVAVIVGNCFSAASIISMYADEVYVGDWAHMMLHNMQHGSYGKDSDVLNQIQHASTLSRRFLKDAYRGFLTEEEIERLFDGKEFWFDCDEMRERFERRFELINSEREIESQQTEFDTE